MMNTLDSYQIDQRYRGLLHAAPDGGPGPRLQGAGAMIDKRVVNHEEETLGYIEEVTLDVELGLVAYAVMRSGGFFAFGERLFAIPWSALTLDAERDCFVMNVDKEYFDNAPSFDKKHWPSMSDRDWHEEVHQYYSTRPYWD
ncbi:MAG TPA: PRC-barrel domain-containing protein [Burkholderiaceae bacterium]